MLTFAALTPGHIRRAADIASRALAEAATAEAAEHGLGQQRQSAA